MIQSAQMSAECTRKPREYLLASSITSEVPPLTVVTYNLLSNKYALSGAHAYCSQEYLSWDFRGPSLWRELRSYDADLYKLQEMDKSAYETGLGKELRDGGYESIYYGRALKDSDAVCGEEEGVALFYRRQRLMLLASRTVRFADHYRGKNGTFWDDVHMREEGAVMAVLHDTAANRDLIAAATHLCGDLKLPDVRLAQANALFKELWSFGVAHGATDAPLLVSGDFNSLWRRCVPLEDNEAFHGQTEPSGVYTLISKGAVNASHQDHPAQRLKTADCLKKIMFDLEQAPLQSVHLSAWGKEPPLTTKIPGFAGCLDYIWLSHGKFAVTHTLKMPYVISSDPDCAYDHFPVLPNGAFSSDHLAMGCKIVWT